MDSIDSGLPGGHAQPHWYDTWDRQVSQSFSSTAKGLRNAPGENNCFLNSAVQVFWHIDVFRRSYRRLSGHLCMGHSCIFCALKVIFTQFQYSDQSSLQPNALRKALANTFAKQERFQLGHMDDAAECFENILNRIHYHIANSHNEDTCTAAHCVPHQKFAMTVFDQLVCPCGSTSEPLKFHEMVHYISANALVSQSRTMQENGDMLHPNRFGLLLRNAGAVGDVRDCPGNCGKRVQIRRTLLNVPDVVSIGLVWGSDKPDPELTTEVTHTIGTTLLLPDIFHSVMCNDCTKLPRLQLSSLVCYYGKHYSTFVWHTKLQTWVYFDDATVRVIGTQWDKVVDKIVRSRYQILLLIYSNPNALPVPTETAPSTRVMAPGYSMEQKNDSREEDKKQSGLSSTKDKTSPPSRQSQTPSLDRVDANQCGESLDRASSEKEQLERKASFEHRRQSSFMIAVTKQKANEAIYAVPHNNSKVMNSLKDISHGDMPNNFVKMSPSDYHGDEVDEPEILDSYNYTLSTSDQYRRPILSNQDPNKLPLTPNFSRVNEAQRKDSFKKGKGKVAADVIRYYVDSNRQVSQSSDSDQGSPVHAPVNGDINRPVVSNIKPVPPVKPAHFRQRSQSLEDNLVNLSDNGAGSNNNNNGGSSHKVIKPKPSSSPMFDNVDLMNRAHTPVQSGLATLPRKKKPYSVNTNISSSESSSSSTLTHSQNRPGSQHLMAATNQQHLSDIPSEHYNVQPNDQTHTSYQNCLTYQNVIDSDLHCRQSSSSSILSQGTVIECSQNEENIDSSSHLRQASSASTDTLTDKPKELKSKSKRKDKEESNKKKEDSKQRKDEKKQKSKKDKNALIASKPPTVSDKKLSQPDEGFTEDNSKLYIDRRMVESVLSFQKLQRSGSCVSQTSTCSVESDSSHGKGGTGISPKDNLSSEIPFDQASLDSHKDSGYGSSDRNSSSSTGSITMNPYEQYFLSRSMIPPKTLNQQLMAENMRKLMDQGPNVNGLEYTQEKDLKSLVTNPNEHHNQTLTVGHCQQYPQQYNGTKSNFDALSQGSSNQRDLTTMSKEKRNQHLYNVLNGRKKIISPPQVPPKNPQGPQQGQQPVNQGPNQTACYKTTEDCNPQRSNPGTVAGDVPLGNYKPADNGLQSFPEGHILQRGNEQFLGFCHQAEDLMDGCVLAETSEQYGDAVSYCQQAIDHLMNAMRLPGISQTSHTYAQHKSNSCLLKLRSLQKRLMHRQESNKSTNSSDSGINHDYKSQRLYFHQSKSDQHLYMPVTGVRPPSRSTLQNSMDGLKEGNTSSSLGRSGTPVFDKVIRPPTDERVPPIEAHMPPSQFHSGLKDRSFETNISELGANNADLYGTLPRRRTQKSQEHTRTCNNQKHEAEVYQDFLDNQRRQTVNHSRTNSGVRTPVNEVLNRDCYDNQTLRSEIHCQQVRPGQAHVRQLTHSTTVNKPYSEQASVPAYTNSQSRPDFALIPIAPPKISNQSQHTEVGIHSESASSVKPIWQNSTNQERSMHGNHGDWENNYGTQYHRNTINTLLVSNQSDMRPNFSSIIASSVKDSNIVEGKLFAASTVIQTAYSTPLPNICMADWCEPVTYTCKGGHALVPASTSTAKFKSGGPNRYWSTETRKWLNHSASFSHPARPMAYTQKTHRYSDENRTSNEPSLTECAKHSGASQPDLRKLSGTDSMSVSQRPLTPQVLCSEQGDESTDSRPVRVRDLLSKFETPSITNEQRFEQHCEQGVQNITNSSHARIAPGNSVPVIDSGVGDCVPLHRQRSKSESEFQVQQPPRPKSVLSKKNKNFRANRLRKSVTFSANICLVAAVDDWSSLLGSGNDHLTQAGYQSDEEERREVTFQLAGTRNDDGGSSSSNSPVEEVGEGGCTLCNMKGVEVGQSYCAKCKYYMSKFTPSR